MELKTLAELCPGQEGTIHQVTGTGLFFNRLRALGLRPEVQLSVVKRAPLGDPIEIRLLGSHLAIRTHEANHILLAV